MHRRRTIRRALALVAVLLLLTAGCGADAGSTDRHPCRHRHARRHRRRAAADRPAWSPPSTARARPTSRPSRSTRSGRLWLATANSVDGGADGVYLVPESGADTRRGHHRPAHAAGPALDRRLALRELEGAGRGLHRVRRHHVRRAPHRADPADRRGREQRHRPVARRPHRARHLVAVRQLHARRWPSRPRSCRSSRTAPTSRSWPAASGPRSASSTTPAPTTSS